MSAPERGARRSVDDRVVSILQDALADEPHPGVERVLHRVHPDTQAGPLRRDWADALQAGGGDLVGRFDVSEAPDIDRDATGPQLVRPLGPQSSDGHQQVTLGGDRPVYRVVDRDKVLVLCGRAVPALVPVDDVRATLERAVPIDRAVGPDEVISGP